MNTIEEFENFVRENYLKKLLEIVKTGKRALLIDFNNLDKYCSPQLADSLLENAPGTLESFNQALQQIDLPVEKQEDVIVRFFNIPKSAEIMIRNIRAKHLSKFIRISGIIIRATDVKPQAIKITYECPMCGEEIEIEQRGAAQRSPERCKCGRRGRFKKKKVVLVDVQRIELEEIPELLEGGEQPERIPVLLYQDLVDPTMRKKVVPGKKVRITGHAKEVPIPLRTGGVSTRFDKIVFANNIESAEKEYEDLKFSKEDLKKIKELSKREDVFEELIKSIVPSIFGYKNVKGALLLQLFGGVKRKNPDGTRIRGDMHILMVGDPGTGKSVMLKYLSHLSPKSAYVTGKGASGVGLTAVVVRDEFLKGWTLEAGSIVLCNQGILCIDEFDKMSNDDRVSMHEALEQQTVSVAKANIHATLRAETSVLAAANPTLGRFDPFKTIPEQINLSPALINRFDLIFAIRDRPGREHDLRIATHVLEGHKNPDANKPKYSGEFIRKYISYAKKNCKPKLSDQAIEVIRDFYVNLRNEKNVEGELRTIPVSARQLEAIARLACASAKLRLSDTVTIKDAELAIKLLNTSLKQVGWDKEMGVMDMGRIITGLSALQRNRVSGIKEIIRNLDEKLGGQSIPIHLIYEETEKAGIPKEKAEELIEKMKREGEIFEPKSGMIRRTR